MEQQIDSPPALTAKQVSPRLPERRPMIGAREALRGRSAGAMLLDRSLWKGLLGPPELSDAEVEALSLLAKPRSVVAGARVFSHDETAHALVFVREGEVILGHRGPDGQFHLVRPVRGPGWLDQSSAWLDGTNGLDALAATASVVVELGRDDVRALFAMHPQLCARFLASLSREVKALAEVTHGLMHKDAPARFAQWLAERCERRGTGDAGVVRLTERKRDIASQLGVTPETLSRVMRHLADKGLISVSGYTVQVHDLPLLEQLADSGSIS